MSTTVESPTRSGQSLALSMRGIVKTFGATTALAGVDLDIRTGEIHALLGQNGSGKSTLMKVAFGEVRPEQGEIEYFGRARRFSSPHDALEAGLAMVPQEFPSALDLTVTENVLLGRLPRRAGVVDWVAAHREARRVLDILGADLSLTTPLRRLAPHERQLVAIGHALACGSRLLILDEPTSSLSVEETGRLFEVMRRMRDQGIGLVFITQRLREVTQVADRITIIRDGHKIGELGPGDDQERIERLVTGSAFEATTVPPRVTSSSSVLTVRRLADGDRLRGIDLTVAPGEIVGISGLLDCGRTELLRTVFGASNRPWTGEIEIGGDKLARHTPATGIRSGVALVTADRRHEGLNLLGSIHDNLMMVRRRHLSLRLLRHRQERSLARRLARDLRIKAQSLSQPVGTLSGGNQQKVVLGKWLALEPRLLLLDEPTRGIDVAAKADFYRTVTRLAEQGVGVVIGSLDDAELLEVCHRVVVLRSGRVVADLDSRSASEDVLLMHAAGLEEE